MLCSRVIEFDSGHRLVNHEGKCAKLHGHRYKAEFYFISKNLDNIGRVIDFGTIYSCLGGWINKCLDHNTILNKKDKALGDSIELLLGQKVYYMESNPTAENIAYHLLHDICDLVIEDKNVVCVKIKLWETPNCFVEVWRDK
ncbi:MAG: 6-carboxytetrahydropterin synthase [Alphaproteobacteria bacterium]|nr:6-carboxytetrahydropterin synthase [Rickettsiales bacterium]